MHHTSNQIASIQKKAADTTDNLLHIDNGISSLIQCFKKQEWEVCSLKLSFLQERCKKLSQEIEEYQEQIKDGTGASISLTRSLLLQNQQLLLGRVRLLGEIEQQTLLVQSDIKANRRLETAVMAQKFRKVLEKIAKGGEKDQ